jgi:hypothetical protein
MNSNKSSEIKPLWEGSCDDDDMCEFADKDDHPAVGSVRFFLQPLTFKNTACTLVIMCIRKWCCESAMLHPCSNCPLLIPEL